MDDAGRPSSGVSAATVGLEYPPGIPLPPTPAAPAARTGLPPGASPINFPPSAPTPVAAPPQLVPFPEQPPVLTSLPTEPVTAVEPRSPPTSPRGHPPTFLPGVDQQMVPGEEEAAAALAEAPVSQEMQDVEMGEEIAPMPQLPPVPQNPAPRNASTELEFYDYSIERLYGQPDFSVQPRVPAAYMFKLLGDKLAGVIMGCTDITKDECINGGIFGLPAKHWDYLQAVKEGKTFYLFNYSRRSLHGVFRSVEPATWQLNPHGWCPSAYMETQFPAQIRVERVDTYPCLREDEYGPILRWKGNYIGNTEKFSFELDAEQVEKLNEIFQSTKEAEPQRPEPPIVGDGRSYGHGGYGGFGGGYGGRWYGYGYGYANRGRGYGYGRGGGGGYGYGRGRGRGGRFRPSFAPRAYTGRGPPRGRGPPIGSTHPLARGGPPRPSASQTQAARVATGPPARPAIEPPPGMGGAPSAMFAASGIPERPTGTKPLP